MTSSEATIDEEFQEVALSNLHLDRENPRLPRGHDWSLASEQDLLQEFLRRYNLIELARSIAEKGFTPRHAEALLVISRENGSGQFTVIEGNRRLATLKLLADRDARSAVGATSTEWAGLAEQAHNKGIQEIPVVVYPDRDSLNDYLGFRHITGPTPWRPEAKARFIARLLGSGGSIGEVAKRIGSNHRTVRRYAEAIAIYNQAASADIDMSEVEAAFGVFYNALDREGVRGYLGLAPQRNITELPQTPVAHERMENLVNLFGLLYGDEEQALAKVIRESRDLRKLGEVLANDRARANLLRDRDLDRAWRVSGGGRDDLLGLLIDAHSKLAEINGQATEYSSDSEVKDEVARVFDIARDMAERYGVYGP